ncbi:MAG: hypothetical protein A2583_02270 [Bdellovibrionales bacterium RIFOXYD1_FULL_53_11]|nr:MAG: hypothetical protein A2583_02270 [Bdellovibrionales bacterium RIFOXYD1_FULL_53_11]
MELFRHVLSEIKEYADKLVILTGPRQCGKTHLCGLLGPDLAMNMDVGRDRILFKRLDDTIKNVESAGKRKPLIFIDEIHRVRGWRNHLKGLFDKHKDKWFVASGSSAFDLLKGDKGDSLAGRAVWPRLHPVTFSEYLISSVAHGGKFDDNPFIKIRKTQDFKGYWKKYFEFGGFPEPLTKQSEKHSAIWMNDYLTAMLDRDVRALSETKDADRVYQTYGFLLESTGTPYSAAAIAGNLDVSAATIIKDVLMLRRILWGFELEPCYSSKAKRLRKAKKFYPVDHSMMNMDEKRHPGQVFEAAVAAMLHRHVSYSFFLRGKKIAMNYFQDYQGHEIDFVLQGRESGTVFVEAKSSASKIGDAMKSFRYAEGVFKPSFKIIVVNEPGHYEHYKDILIVGPDNLAAALF